MVPGGPSPVALADSEMPPQDPSQIAPTDPSQPVQPGDNPISPEQKQTLLTMIDQIRSKLGSFHAVNFASQNKLEQMKGDALKQVFEKLQMMGVDLTDKDSVSQFIANLQQQNPELAAAFEKAMDFLLGGQGAPQAPQDPTQSMDLSMPPQNNMNNQNPNDQQQAAPQNIPQG